MAIKALLVNSIHKLTTLEQFFEELKLLSEDVLKASIESEI